MHTGICPLDPLSITASAIAVATLAAKLCSILAEIREQCTALPGRLHAVNNEIQDLRVVLEQVAAVVKEHKAHNVHGDVESKIPELLWQGRDRLLALQHLLSRVQGVGLRKRELFFRTVLWKKQQGTLAVLQGDIKRVKSSLNVLLGVSNS
ncbi:hypothetical protein QBC46DRAFT_9240 [Diplogelasinospora grovesii]|uniref:Fungal N-terminal domain-containing protein n=1 Tax=Diplogelasinospora grovesii TaxID=303347 RepID=A0AAN6N335_9PEZI|nr:hypothetical protein QBC46DRAFT_9240 [Diplogelasinospora grovesii]